MSMRSILTLLIALFLALSPVVLANDDNATEEEENETHSGEEKSGEDDEKGDDREARSGDDDEDDDDDFEVKRKVKFEVSGQQAQIKLSRESGDSEDEVKVHYVANSGTLKVEYESENATTETETELKIRVKEVLEFRDLDGDGAYDKNETVVSQHSIGSLDWRIDGPDPVNTSGKTGQRISGIGEFPEGGALILVMYVYGDFTNVNGTSLAPTDVKIDIIFDHFPYTANDTLIALIIKSEQESKIEVEGDEDGEMVAESNGFAAYFEWADNATVDGVTQPVHTTLLKAESDEDEEMEKTFALSYARGAYINHDPVLGVQSAGSDARSVPGFGVAIVLIAAVGVLAFARRRP